MPRKLKKRKVAKKKIRAVKAPRKIKKAVKVVRRPTLKRGQPRTVRASRRKIRLVLQNMILFIILSLISWFLFSLIKQPLFESLFLLLAIVNGFIALAFLIILLVFLFMRAMKK